MIVKKVTDEIYYIGLLFMNCHLIKSKESVLFDCAISQLVPSFLKSLKELNKVIPEYLVLLHSHFDHIGGITRLKKTFPSLKTIGSEITNKNYNSLKIEKLYKQTMNKINENELFKIIYSDSDDVVDFESGEIDIIVKEGEELQIEEDRKIKFFETPGHTPCNLSAFDEKTKTLFISDSCGIPFFTGKLWPTAFQDFEIYKNSIKKLIELKPEFLCISHAEFLSGEYVLKFLNQALEETDIYKNNLFKLYNDNKGDINKILEKLLSEYEKEITYIQPDIFKYGNRKMLEQIRKLVD